MAFEAQFHSGDPVMVPYTPGSDVAAGKVIVVGVTAQIAHNDIKSGRIGALAAGGGLYVVAKDANAIGAKVIVYWDDTNKVATATAGSNKKLGTSVLAALDTDGTVLVQHVPNNA